MSSEIEYTGRTIYLFSFWFKDLKRTKRDTKCLKYDKRYFRKTRQYLRSYGN